MIVSSDSSHIYLVADMMDQAGRCKLIEPMLAGRKVDRLAKSVSTRVDSVQKEVNWGKDYALENGER